jgi:hypothetical protein
MTPALPQDKTDLLERIQRDWSALMQAIERLTPEQMSIPDAGGWSIKDNLAHLTAWEQFMLLHYLQGRPPHETMQIDAATLERLDENGINAVLFERNRNRAVADVLDGLRRSHEQVVAFLEQMPFSDLMKPRFPDDPQVRPLINWVIGNTYDHYQEHLSTIKSQISNFTS